MDATRTRRGLAAALLVALVGAGCASTKLTSVWREEDWSGGPLRSVLVIGLSRSEGARQLYETEMVERLREVGVEALASIEVIPSYGQITPAMVADWAKERGIEGVIVTQLIRREERERYIPPTYDFYGYYGARWPMVVSPGYVTQDTIVHLETNLYDVPTGRLLWSGTSESFNPGSREHIVRELTPLLVERLREAGLI
jgi:hypothetical protein